MNLMKKMTPIFILVFAFVFAGSTFLADTADARSRRGGKSFRTPPKQTQVQRNTATAQQPRNNSFLKGLGGGLLGGALGAMLFGSLMGGEGMGMLLPILVMAGLGFFLFRRFAASKQNGGRMQQAGAAGFGQQQDSTPGWDSGDPLEQGLADIRRSDPGFDKNSFLEIASDCFFQVQAGWARRDLNSYRNLLGDQLASEYEVEFARLNQKGVINKLESISIRKVEMVDAGCTGDQDFVTLLFQAYLLDYTVDEKTGEIVDGSNTQPVKFEEEWTWARPVGTHDWRLEGIDDPRS